MTKNHLSYLLTFALALVLRLGFAFTSANQADPRVADVREFQALALGLVTRGQYALVSSGQPVASKMPLWPLLLSLFYRVFGPASVRPEQIFLCLVGALTCVAIVRLTPEVFSNRPGLALTAGIIAAIDPYTIEWSGYLLSETLYVFLTVVLLLAISRAVARSASRSILLGALALGLGMLAHPTAMIYSGALITWRFFCRSLSWPRLLTMIVGALIILSPWLVRNFLTFHALIPATTQGGAMLIGNYNPWALSDPNARGTWQAVSLGTFLQATGGDPRQATGLDDVAYDHLARRAALKWIMSHPGTSGQLAIWKMVYLWLRWPDRGLGKWLGYLAYLVLLAAAVLGVIRARPLSPIAQLILWCAFWSTLLAVVSGGEGRYRAQLEPLIALFAAGGFAWIYEALQARLYASPNAAPRRLEHPT